MTNSIKYRLKVFAVLAIVSLLIVLGFVATSNITNFKIDHNQNPHLSTQQSQTDETESWSPEVAPNYYLVNGTATQNFTDLIPGESYYCDLDELGRSLCAVALIDTDMRTQARETDRADISMLQPSGWGHNAEVTIVSTLPDLGDYHGWFWNRSHLLADSLGGEAIVENLITGTRTQNVGNRNNSGGMAFTETIARDYLDSDAAINCPLYYEVNAEYVALELVPRSTTIDMKNCDESIDMHVLVFNVANGFTVNYSTGEFSEN